MKCILIKAGEKAQVIEVKGRTIGYEKMKELLEIDSPVTVIERKINGKCFDLWLDDEGLLKPEDKRIITGVLDDKNASEILVGNLLILKSNKKGESIGLTDSEIEDIMDFRNLCLIDMDDFAKWRGHDPNADLVITGYFDGGSCTCKAHCNWLSYKL